MIPPISPSLIENNPDFAVLHKNLTANLLNPDASSKTLTDSHRLTTRSLNDHRLRGSKNNILIQGMNYLARTTPSTSSKTPSDSREIYERLSMLLEDLPYLSLTTAETDLLAEDLDTFHALIPLAAKSITRILMHEHAQLQTLAADRTISPRTKSPTQNPPNSLPALLQPLLHPLATSTLSTTLTHLSSTQHTASTLHRALLLKHLTHLERTTLGLEVRHSKARVAHLAAVAGGLAGKSRVGYLGARRGLYSREMQEGVRDYLRLLREVEGEWGERERRVREAVEEMESVRDGDREGDVDGRGRKGVMREVGRRYGEVLEEVQRVRGEIEDLKEREKREKGGRLGKVG